MWADAVLFLVVLFVAVEEGFRFGLRHHHAGSSAEKRTRGDVTLGSMLALLGLMLAFTYAFTLSRANARKQSVVEEANAIGTAFLKADLLPEPGRSEVRARPSAASRDLQSVASRHDLRIVRIHDRRPGRGGVAAQPGEVSHRRAARLHAAGLGGRDRSVATLGMRNGLRHSPPFVPRSATAYLWRGRPAVAAPLCTAERPSAHNDWSRVARWRYHHPAP